MLQAGRSRNAGGYRFGFQGQEADNKIGGLGQHTTAQFWEYDTWAVKRWNTDPVTFPWQSTYATFNNNPILFSDPLGDCPDCPEEDIFNDPYIIPRLITTAFYDTKHAIYNTAFRALYANPVSTGRIVADYKKDANGNPIFETEFTYKENGTPTQEAVGAVGDIVQIATTTAGGPSSLTLAKTPSQPSQTTNAIKKSWLRYHEGIGIPPSHTIRLHVGQSRSQLLARLNSNPQLSRATSFSNEAQAESVISSTIRSKQVAIKSWLKSGSNGYLNLDYIGNANKPVGYGINQGQTNVSNYSNARVVLKKNGKRGYVIQTAFPK
jgi:hypothetical protein